MQHKFEMGLSNQK